MATGKTNARWIRVSVDDSGGSARDISSSVDDISEVGLTHDEEEVTCFSDGMKTFTLGHPDAPIDISGPLNNTATTGAHTVFTGIVGDESQTYTVTVQFGIRAAPTTGDPEYEGEYACSQYTVSGNRYSARMVPSSQATAAPAWGTVA